MSMDVLYDALTLEAWRGRMREALAELPMTVLGRVPAACDYRPIAVAGGKGFLWPALRLALVAADPLPTPALDPRLGRIDCVLARPMHGSVFGASYVAVLDLDAHGGEPEQAVAPALDEHLALWFLNTRFPNIGLELTGKGLQPRLSTPFGDDDERRSARTRAAGLIGRMMM